MFIVVVIYMKKLKYNLINIIVSIFQLCLWISMRLLLFIFTNFKIEGRDNLKHTNGKSVIFAPNHASELDPILLGTALSAYRYIKLDPVYFVTYDYKFYADTAQSWFTALLYRITPFIITGSVPKKAGYKDYAISVRDHISLLKNGKSVCIFPEGKMTIDGKLGKPRGGATYMSHVANVPIVPVAISGTFGLSVKKFLTGRPSIVVSFDKPIYASDILLNELPQVECYRKASEHILALIKSKLT